MNVAPVIRQAAPVNSRGWTAALELRAVPRGPRTIIRRERGIGPLTMQRAFHPEGAPAHVVLLHPPGGCVGGDALALDFHVEPDAHALVTSVAATKSYRCEAGSAVSIEQRLDVATGGALEWLPNELIAFGGTALRMRSRLVLSPGARAILADTICLGRPASGDDFLAGVVDSRVDVVRRHANGALSPWFSDRQRLSAGAPATFSNWGLGGLRTLGLLCATPMDAERLEIVRATLTRRDDDLCVGATLLDGLLVLRLLGRSTHLVIDALRRAWVQLRPLVLQRPAMPPRIWAT